MVKQRKLNFGDDGVIEIAEIKRVESEFKIGDKVVFNSEYPHMEGVFTVDELLWTWSDEGEHPLYVVNRKEDGHNLHSCCTGSALIRVDDG